MNVLDCLGVLTVVTPVLVVFGLILRNAERNATRRREDWERRFRHEAGTQMVEQLVGSNAAVEASNAAFVPGPPPFSTPGPFVRPSRSVDEDVLFRYTPDTRAHTGFVDGVFVTSRPNEWWGYLEVHNETSGNTALATVHAADLRGIANGLLLAAERLEAVPVPAHFVQKPLPPPPDPPKRRSMWDRLKGEGPFDG